MSLSAGEIVVGDVRKYVVGRFDSGQPVCVDRPVLNLAKQPVEAVDVCVRTRDSAYATVVPMLIMNGQSLAVARTSSRAS